CGGLRGRLRGRAADRGGTPVLSRVPHHERTRFPKRKAIAPCPLCRSGERTRPHEERLMSSWRGFAMFLVAAGIVAVTTLVALGLVIRSRSPGIASTMFRECAAEVGLTWQMRFLPNEQGENFRINLYDHGCGLAVGDFDGDGYDDIYFCNQLGP